MARGKKKVRVTGPDKEMAAEQNRKAVLDFIHSAGDEDLADMIFENFADLKRISGSIDWDEARDAIMEGRSRGKQTRAVTEQILAQAKDSDLDKIKVKGLKRITAMEAAIARTEARIKFENQYGHAGATILKGVNQFAGVVASIGITPFKLLAGTADILHGSRLYAQKALGIAPVKGAIIGTLMTADALLGAAAYAASPHEIVINNGNSHMMMAFQQACISSGSPLSAAYDVAFSPDYDSENNPMVYNTMKVSEAHGVPALALHLISYLESNRHKDMVSNNSSASNYFQVIDSTKLDYMGRYGQETTLYNDALQAIEDGTANADLKLRAYAINGVSQLSGSYINDVLRTKFIPDDVYAALNLADNPAMQGELISIDMRLKTDIEKATTPEEVRNIAANYYRRDHFLGSGMFKTLTDLSQKHPSLPIDAADNFVGKKTANNLREVVKGNPGLLKPGMTAQQALDAIKEKFINFTAPAYDKFMASYNPNKSVIETCMPDFMKANVNIQTISKGEYTTRLMAQAYTALTPAFIQSGIQQIGESFGATPELTPKKTAMADKAPPIPLMRPDYL